ncbi:hypothetical protein NPIL_450561 [Nephila pilipes]|uniref:Uncharacterized protein n=1 Tax=Nephila pilipes TaxID=299642 RepID=A0A8X6TFE0_NEPPI|nr:hypothetical protein NPIL_450561 [Nephila pilipes]
MMSVYPSTRRAAWILFSPCSCTLVHKTSPIFGLTSSVHEFDPPMKEVKVENSGRGNHHVESHMWRGNDWTSEGSNKRRTGSGRTILITSREDRIVRQAYTSPMVNRPPIRGAIEVGVGEKNHCETSPRNESEILATSMVYTFIEGSVCNDAKPEQCRELCNDL